MEFGWEAHKVEMGRFLCVLVHAVYVEVWKDVMAMGLGEHPAMFLCMAGCMYCTGGVSLDGYEIVA